MTQIPQYLYKYTKINEHLFEFLTLNRIYFPEPEEFNDPFDCGIAPKFKPTDLIVAKSYVDSLRSFPGLTDYVRRIDENGFDQVMSDCYEGYKQHVESMKKKIRVLCLSAVESSPPMFAHYSDQHKGVCLKLDSSLIPYNENLQPADYPDVFPMIDLLGQKDPEQDYKLKVRLQYYTKSKDWAYEKEWRVVIRNDEVGKYSFRPEMLVGIIFGNNISEGDRSNIIKLMQSQSRIVSFQQVIGLNSDFTLEIIDI